VLREAGDFARCLITMNDPYGSRFLNDGNGSVKAFLGLFWRIIGYGFPDLLYGLSDPGLVPLVPYPSDFVLPCALDGGWMVGQI
jgi:hypothetical protein